MHAFCTPIMTWDPPWPMSTATNSPTGPLHPPHGNPKLPSGSGRSHITRKTDWGTLPHLPRGGFSAKLNSSISIKPTHTEKTAVSPPHCHKVTKNRQAKSLHLHRAIADSSGLARCLPDVLPNKIPFTFPDHHRLRNDLQTEAATEAGSVRG